MRKVWLNNGEPNEEGFYEAVVENRNGQIISRYKGTLKQVADQLLESQVQANRQIGRLMRPDQGRTPIKLEPRNLTDGDTLRLAQELDDPDPSKRVGAVSEIIEARLGGKPEEVAKEVNTVSQERSDAYYRAEAEAFVAEHPEYYPVQENQNLLFRELMARQIDLTRNNLQIVYNDLLERGELVAWPGDQPPPPASSESGPDGGGGGRPDGGAAAVAAPPNVRERRVSISTGIRHQDANAAPPSATKKKPIVTKVELANMSKAEYMTRLRDPEFRMAVDALT